MFKSHWHEKAKQKASVTILADFCPEFNPPFRWRSKHKMGGTMFYKIIPFLVDYIAKK